MKHRWVLDWNRLLLIVKSLLQTVGSLVGNIFRTTSELELKGEGDWETNEGARAAVERDALGLVAEVAVAA